MENTISKCETPTPEIQIVMSILDKEIQRLDENISLLTQKLDPVLMPERRPSQVVEERGRKECKLAEDIHKDIDIISRLNELIDELRYRIAL